MTWVLSAIRKLLKFVLITIVAAIALPFVLIVILLCIVPIRYSVNAEFSEKTNAIAKASYLFGAVRVLYRYKDGEGHVKWRVFGFPLSFKKTSKTKQNKEDASEASTAKKAEQTEITPGSTIPGEKQEEKSAEKPKAGVYKKLKSAKAYLTSTQGKTIIKLALEASKRLFITLMPKHLNIQGSVGFSNPADTGLFIGAYEAIAGVAGVRDSIRLRGDFDTDKTVIQIILSARGSLSIARLSKPALWLLTKKPIRTGIMALLRKEDSDE